jgi:hypothetical protein
MAVDFGAAIKEAEKAGMLESGDRFKLKDGANKFRLMTECLAHNGEYQGKKNFKWLCQILDRADDRIKLFFMPHTIYKQIAALQQNEEYAFYDVPMPYDITITAKGAGTIDVEYTLMPARKETALTDDERELLAAAKPLKDIKKALDEKAAQKKPATSEAQQMADTLAHARQNAEQIDKQGADLTDEDIPFAWVMPLVLPASSLLALGSYFA